MLNRRAQAISNTNFEEENFDFAKIRIGSKKLEDAILDLDTYKRVNPRLGDKDFVLRAINENKDRDLRQISDFFYRTSGIYSRLCRYMAYLYRYDWMVTPYINSDSMKKEKILDGFNKVLNFLDKFEIKKFFGEVALKVIRYGCYYGYVVRTSTGVTIQELDPTYCRSRFIVNNKPVIEFNMKYFDDKFTDIEQKMKILKVYPKEFAKGYVLYKQGKLPAEFVGDSAGWYVLEVGAAFRFNLNGSDIPPFISVIPAIIDLNDAQALDKKKMQQKLLKIIIQKMPLDKNNDLVFDVDEARELHNNAVQMLNKAIGVDVLTTFADVDVADLADNSTVSSIDELDKVERTVYNEAGVSQNQFNTDGNLALEKSILNDEAFMYNLVTQFESFLNDLIAPFNKNPKKIEYRVQLLTTTIYNYKDMAKLFKEQTQLGYSKMLPQIALGQSQSSILATAYFENDILELFNVFIPPLMSSTMNIEALKDRQSGDGQVGRKELDDDQKSDKTIRNRESMG